MANFPKVLKDYRVYLDGYDTGASANSITLPKITQKIEEISLGSFVLPVTMGLELMEAEIELFEQDKNILLQWGLLNNTTGQLVTFRGYQTDNTGESNDIRVDMRGIYKEYDLGQWSKGETGKVKLNVALTQFSYTIDHIPYVVIEPLTNTFIIGGVNQLSKQKKSLGII
ncbi:phage major tail tube protein [Candidatus Hepatincola sp. Pdp]